MSNAEQDNVRNRGAGGRAAALDEVRAHIDAIDSQLCDLIRQRTALAREVAAAKQAQGNSRPVRPAREAQIIRKMTSALAGQVPVVSVTRIWRELIASTIEAHQGGLTVLVSADGALWDLSREHFGSAPRLELCPDMPVILRRLRDNQHTLAVMPEPRDDDPSPWWAQMLDVDGPQPRVLARLPFVRPQPPRLDAVGAVAVAAGAEPEPSGDDRTLLVVRFDRDYSRASVAETLRSAGWTVRDLMSWRAPDSSPVNLVMVEIEGFVAADDPGIDAAIAAARGHIQRITHFGAYPTQIAMTAPAAERPPLKHGGSNG
ncbi:MAG: chorismate mutase [Alphaproteobacteria bacterium]